MNTRTLTDRELLAELNRHGFKQSRHTTHGILWTCKGYRFMTPLIRGGASFNDQGRHSEARTREWLRLTAEMYRALPGWRERVARKEARVDIHAEVAAMRPLDEVQRTALAESVALHMGPMPDIAARIEEAVRPSILPPPETPLTPSPEPPPLAAASEEAPPMSSPVAVEKPPPAQAERLKILKALEQANGNRILAAATLEWSKTFFFKKLSEHAIEFPPTTGWICPTCKGQYKQQGRHREACPASAPPLPAPALLQGKVQPRVPPAAAAIRTPWEVTARPAPRLPGGYGQGPGPLAVALRGTFKSGKALCFQRLSAKEMKSYRTRAASVARRMRFSCRTQDDRRGTLWLWFVKLVPRRKPRGGRS